MILQLDSETLEEELDFLLACVDVMCPVLSEAIQLVAVVIHGVVPLFQVEEILQLAAHKTHW
jgi:hypothetical protein